MHEAGGTGTPKDKDHLLVPWYNRLVSIEPYVHPDDSILDFILSDSLE
jgi:hypothetical protein